MCYAAWFADVSQMPSIRYNVWRTWDLVLYPLALPLARRLAEKSDVVKATHGIAFVILDTTFGVYYSASIIDRACTLGVLGRLYLAQPLMGVLAHFSLLLRGETPCEMLYASIPASSFN